MKHEQDGCPIPGRVLPREAVDEIADRVSLGDKRAEEEACTALAFFIWGLSRRLAYGDMAYFREDLFAVGLDSAIGAFRKYDRSRGVAATTFAHARAWGHMRNACKKERRNAGAGIIGYGHEYGGEDSQRSDSCFDDIDAALEIEHRLRKAELSPREFAVIRRRFGLNGAAPLSYRGIVKFVKLSIQGVANVEDRAIQKLRSAASA